MMKQPELPDFIRDMEIQRTLNRMGNTPIFSDVEQDESLPNEFSSSETEA